LQRGALAKARKDGLKEGREKGREEGLKQGIEQGIEQGEKKARFDTAWQMLHDQFPLEIIVKYTGLTEEEIKAMGENKEDV